MVRKSPVKSTLKFRDDFSAINYPLVKKNSLHFKIQTFSYNFFKALLIKKIPVNTV